ncbi:MAG: choice-of-anchor D domain-containing protein, partial [Planctomycetaceae bacterium]
MYEGQDLAIDEQYDRLYAVSSEICGIYTVDLQSGVGSLWQFGDECAYGMAVGFSPSAPYVWAGSSGPEGGCLFYYDRASGDLAGYFDIEGEYYSNYTVASRGVQVTPNGNVIYKTTSFSSQRLGIIGLSSLYVSVGKILLVSDSSGSSSDKSITFADTRTGQPCAPQTFTLSSSGSEPLNITSWKVPNQANFTVTVQDDLGNAIDTSSGGFVIPGGKDYTVTVTLNSSIAGSKSGTITFGTNDTKNRNVTLNVSGQVGTPVLKMSTQSIDFGSIKQGESPDAISFLLTNTGTSSLNITDFDVSGVSTEDFSVSVKLGFYPYSTVDTSGGSFSIPAGQAYYIQTQFVLETVGAKSGTIRFNTNDDNNPTVTLSLTGEVLPSPDLTISISQVSPQYAVYIPGDRISMVATISNIGAMPAVVDPANPIVVDINLGDETAYEFYIPFTLDAGAVIERQISFYLPEPGVYDIVAIVDYNSVVVQPDYENDFAYGETLDVEAAFGEVPGRSGNLPLKLTDYDGTQVTMKLTGGGMGILDLYSYYDGYNYISITGSTANSRLEILTANSGAEEDDGRFTLSGLTVGNSDDSSDYTSLGTVEAKTTDLVGDIFVAGTLGSLQIGDVYGIYGQAFLTISGQDEDGIATGRPASLQFRRVVDLSINSSVRIKSLSACCWFDLEDDTDLIYAPSLGTLTITGSEELNQPGDFQANIELYGSDDGNTSTPTLSKAKIANNVAGSEWLITGNVGQVEIGGIIGNLDTPWTLDANRIDELKLGDVLNAAIYAGSKVNLITSERWQMGTINAETIGSLITTGRTGR